MTAARQDAVYYRRSRFATHLPLDRRYAPSHFWLREDPAGVWTIGFTRFAIRMLGDMVDFGFALAPGASVELGAEIGSVEGFKAVTALYCVAQGEFLGSNAALDGDITLVETDPYGRGWLYRVRGAADPACTDVDGYVALLDATIDRMLDGRHDQSGATDDTR